MLLDPFEKQLHLPAAFVKLSNRQSGQKKVVGQKREALACFGIEVADAPEFLWISLGRIVSGEQDRLVRDQSGGFVDRVRIESSELEIAFGANHKEGQGLMERIKTLEVEVTAIQDVEGTGLGNEIVEDID